MALVNCYTTLQAVRDSLNITVLDENSSLESFINSSCRAIDMHCGQFFYDSGSATARTFRVDNRYCAKVDPFHTLTGLAVKTDDDDDGTFETTWTAADYELERFGGAMADMLSAPYDRINAVGSYYFPTGTRRRFVLQVTARWGWAAVPSQVAAAAELVSADLWKRRDAPLGVTLTDFGPLRISQQVFDKVAALIGPLRRYERVAGIA